MAATTPAAATLRFGVFELDVRAGELRKRGVRMPIQGLPLQVLAALLATPNQVVLRDELRAQLWPSDTFVDFDHSLHNAIARLREALGDDASSPRFIETLPRRGYRFIAPVEAQSVAAEPAAAAPRRSPTRVVVLVCGVAVVLVSIAVGFSVRNTGVGRIQSIAVLPLRNLSADQEQDYFAEGMTDALITNLGKIGALRVISRTSVMQYKDTRTPLPEIARKLRVDAVVEGSVARSGNRVRITANLVQGSPERHLWSETYERDLEDVLMLQADVARAIVDEIRVALTPSERAGALASRAVDPEVYQLYLRGRYFWNRRTEDGLRKALDYFQQAIDRDPSYAPAYAGLADAWVPLGYFDIVPPREAGARARAAAIKALALDDQLAEAHTSLGAVLEYHDWDWSGAEREFKRAIQLNPNYATAHQWYAQLLAPLGRTSEYLAESRRAQELDPLSLIINTSVGHRLYLAREFDSARRQLRSTIELDPKAGYTHWNLGMVHEAEGDYAAAIDAYDQATQLTNERPSMLAALARGYAKAGREREARTTLDHLIALRATSYVSPFDIACVYVGLDERDLAFEWLERAFDERSNRLAFIKVDPVLDPLRRDPRFAGLLRRMGLAGAS